MTLSIITNDRVSRARELGSRIRLGLLPPLPLSLPFAPADTEPPKRRLLCDRLPGFLAAAPAALADTEATLHRHLFGVFYSVARAAHP